MCACSSLPELSPLKLAVAGPAVTAAGAAEEAARALMRPGITGRMGSSVPPAADKAQPGKQQQALSSVAGGGFTKAAPWR